MARVRIVALGDTHGLHRQALVPEGDILVHTGDFMKNFGDDEREIIDFNFWLSEQTSFETRMVIAGNHDQMFAKQSSYARSFLTNAIYLEDSGHVSHGLKFWGSPYTPEFMGWSFMAARGGALARHWKLIPHDTDVLVVHGPPLGYLDKYEGKHVGCEALASVLYQRKVRLLLCGHIHTGYGQARLSGGDTVLANVAVLDTKGLPTQPATVIDIEVP